VNIFLIGYADFSEWFIGHSGSTYWTKKDSDTETYKAGKLTLTTVKYPDNTKEAKLPNGDSITNKPDKTNCSHWYHDYYQPP
jgi:hypothetical protein